MFSIVLLTLFLAVMVIVGLWAMKRTKTLNDFFLGGRRVGPWVSAFAYGTTYFSAVIFIGFAGKIGWGYGLNGLWIAAGNAFLGTFLAWLVLGRRTRRMSQNLDVMTMPEFLHERFQGTYIKMISAVIIFVFLTPYCASVFKGLGHLFEASFGIPYEYALMIMIGITGIYLILGGYSAIVVTDFIQGMVMLGGSAALVWILSAKAGGFVQSVGLITEKYAAHTGGQPDMLLLGALVFMTSFGVWGMPQMVQKFYAIKNEKVIPRAAAATFIFALVISFAAYYTGALTHVFFDRPLAIDGKAAFDRMIPGLLTTHLHPAFLALILLLVLSASMSTLSSLVLVSASAIAIDLYKGHINPAVSKENSVAMMRFLSGVFVFIAYFIARYDFTLIVTLMSLSWGVVSGAFMAPFVYGLYWKRATKMGVKAGMATGAVLGVALFFTLGPARSPIASSIAMLVPFAVVPLVSFFTRPPDRKVIDKAFEHI